MIQLCFQHIEARRGKEVPDVRNSTDYSRQLARFQAELCFVMGINEVKLLIYYFIILPFSYFQEMLNGTFGLLDVQ